VATPEKIDLDQVEVPVAVATAAAKLKPARKPTRPEFLVVSERKFWSPFRLVSLGIACVLLTIVFVLVQKQRRDYWTKQLRDVAGQVGQAVEARDWVAANKHYQVAAKAIGILKRDDAASRRMLQGLRETTALTGLCAGSLIDLIEDAEKEADKPETWEKTFNARYRDQWLGIESPLAKSDSDSGNEWRIELPGKIGDQNREVVIHANLDVFSVVGSLPPEQSLIFAAQIESCELSSDKQRWIVRLRNDSGFLWCDPRTYSGLGFTFHEWHTEGDVFAVLREQARRVDIPIEFDQIAKGDPDHAEPGPAQGKGE
jgi:hypothetical protein